MSTSPSGMAPLFPRTSGDGDNYLMDASPVSWRQKIIISQVNIPRISGLVWSSEFSLKSPRVKYSAGQGPAWEKVCSFSQLVDRGHCMKERPVDWFPSQDSSCLTSPWKRILEGNYQGKTFTIVRGIHLPRCGCSGREGA